MLLGYIMSIIYLTLLWGGFYFPVTYYHLNIQPFIWVTQTYEMGYLKMIKQLLTNIAMFVPYGILLPLVFKNLRTWWKTDLIVFATSFMIELIQYFIGRSCDVDDLIMNTIGGCIGYGVFLLIHMIMNRRKNNGKIGKNSLA